MLEEPVAFMAQRLALWLVGVARRDGVRLAPARSSHPRRGIAVAFLFATLSRRTHAIKSRQQRPRDALVVQGLLAALYLFAGGTKLMIQSTRSRSSAHARALHEVHWRL